MADRDYTRDRESENYPPTQSSDSKRAKPKKVYEVPDDESHLKELQYGFGSGHDGANELQNGK